MKEQNTLIARLNVRAEHVCAYLLPNGTRSGKEWKVGSLKGEPGKSLSICIEGENLGVWADFATGDEKGRDLISLWARVRKFSRQQALAEADKWLWYNAAAVQTRPNATEPEGPVEAVDEVAPFNWDDCVQAVTSYLPQLAQWRGLSFVFVEWLHQQKLLGLYEGGIAFPIHDERGIVIGCQAYHGKKGRGWKIQGGHVCPLVIGDPSKAGDAHIFESQWDAFVLMDRLRLYDRNDTVVIVTRGASNGGLVKGLLDKRQIVYAYIQNDELKNGKRAGDEWLKNVLQYGGVAARAVVVPPEFKDLNEWVKAGATNVQLRSAMQSAEILMPPRRR
jgi:hypothetical protein